MSPIFSASLTVTDLIAFWFSTRDLWDTWRLKRDAGLQRPNDIITMLLRQSIMRISLIFIVLATSAVSHQVLGLIVAHAIENLGLTLVVIMVTDFILDLRQCNYASTEEDVTTWSTMRFHNILQQLHESIIVELRTPICTEEGSGRNNEMLGRSHDGELVHTRPKSCALE